MAELLQIQFTHHKNNFPHPTDNRFLVINFSKSLYLRLYIAKM